MSVSCECCVSGRGLGNALITRPEKSYRLRCVVVCDLETSRMRRPWPALGRSAKGGKENVMTGYAWLMAGCSTAFLQRQTTTDILKEILAYAVLYLLFFRVFL